MSTTPVEAVLPEQTPRTLQEKIQQVRQQQTLLAQMRASGDSALQQQAAALQEQYHVRDMATLAGDVYASAAHAPAPPGLGWIRVSEHPELLRERLGLDWSDQQIEDYLQPLHSDFRAEIYLPDPRVYGPEVVPVISIKGSNGLVAVPDGRGGTQWRNSALEDWIENARQGIGLESDHANRAMKLAAEFHRDFHKPFENVGHSKGAADASANAELTGTRAYIYNAAGLNALTVQRYADQHQLTVLGNDRLIHSYHVLGEVLHETQQGVHDMDGLTRAQLGVAARQLAELGEMRDLRSLARSQLAQALPYDPKMQHAALELVDHLATHSGTQLLKELPLAAGARQIELPAKMRLASGELADRPPQPTVGEVGAQAGPLLNVVSGALAGGVIGKRTGDVVAHGGQTVDRGLQRAGALSQTGAVVLGYVLNDQVQGHGRLVAGAMHYGGAAAADMRVAVGHAESLVDRGMGTLASWNNAVSGAITRAESHLPFMDGLQALAERNDRATAAYVERKQAQATQDQRDARQDAVAIRHVVDAGAAGVLRASDTTGHALQHGAEQVGSSLNDSYRAMGASVRGVTDRAPEAGAALGAAGGTGTVAASELVASPIETLWHADRLWEHGGNAVAEAITRHGVQDVVLPSLDARTRQMERVALERMHGLQASAQQHARSPLTPGDDPNAFLQRMLDSAEAGNWSAFRNDTQTLAGLQPGQELRAQAVAQVDRQQQPVAQQATEPQQATQQATARGMSR